jgi:predicted MPP superfamily phosphohydrolase
VFGGRRDRPIRLVQLSDLHLSRSVTAEMILHAFRLAIEEKPDFVCLTGDYITRSYGQSLDGYADLFRELSSRFPTFAVKGNHDGGVWAQYYLNDPAEKEVDEILSHGGVRLLMNSAEAFTKFGAELWVAGVGDLWSEAVDGKSAFAKIPTGAPTVLLAHNPDSKDALQSFAWQLMLSGHTHGGQNGIPGLQRRFAPVEDKRFVAGLNWWPERRRWIHTNVGIGNLQGFRILCRPEVSVLELV